MKVKHPVINEPINIVTLHKKPKSKTTVLRKALEHLIINNLRNSPSVIIGDFNIQSDVPSFNNFFDSYGFKQVIHEVTTNFGTTIDLCFTNIKSFNAGVHEMYFSYHKGIWIQISSDLIY